MLCLEEISLSFDGNKVLSNVSFCISKGESVGLIGPNGAGKSSLLSVVMGFLPPDSGTVMFEDRRVTRLPPHAIGAMGIAHTFQKVRIFPQMSVLENVMAAMPNMQGDGFWAGIFHTRAMKESERIKIGKAHDYLGLVGLDFKANDLAGNLSYGQKKRLEMARAMAQEPKLMLLDEPTAGVDNAVIQDILDIIRTILDQGITVLLVEHNMKVVRSACNRLVALDGGRVIAEGIPEKVLENEKVIGSYLG